MGRPGRPKKYQTEGERKAARSACFARWFATKSQDPEWVKARCEREKERHRKKQEAAEAARGPEWQVWKKLTSDEKRKAREKRALDRQRERYDPAKRHERYLDDKERPNYKARTSEASKRWRERHPEKWKEIQHRRSHPGYGLPQKKWKSKNPEKCREYRRRYNQKYYNQTQGIGTQMALLAMQIGAKT